MSFGGGSGFSGIEENKIHAILIDVVRTSNRHFLHSASTVVGNTSTASSTVSIGLDKANAAANYCTSINDVVIGTAKKEGGAGATHTSRRPSRQADVWS